MHGEKCLAHVGLEEFLGQLMRSGRPDWVFLKVCDGKVTLLQANQLIPEVVPEWLLDGMERVTQGRVKNDDRDAESGKCPLDGYEVIEMDELGRNQEKMVTYNEGIEKRRARWRRP